MDPIGAIKGLFDFLNGGGVGTILGAIAGVPVAYHYSIPQNCGSFQHPVQSCSNHLGQTFAAMNGVPTDFGWIIPTVFIIGGCAVIGGFVVGLIVSAFRSNT